MADPVNVALLVVALSVYIFLSFQRYRRNRKRYPPGPTGLPIVGSALFIPSRDYLYFETLKQKYGDLMLLKVGPLKFVYLNTVKAMREALVNQADVFSGRLRSEYGDELTGSSGIIFRDGPEWREHRRFTLKALRDFGAGRLETEEKALAEFDFFLKRLPTDVPVEVFSLFVESTNNLITELALGERCGSEDPEFQEFQRRMTELLDRGQALSAIIPLIFPFLMKIPFLNQLIEKHSGMKSIVDFSHAYIRRKIDQHEAEITDINQEPRDVCDALLLERMRLENLNLEEGHTFTYQQLIRDLLELYIAGTDTTAVTLTWAVFLMAINPDVQMKVQEEIDSKIVRNRSVTMKDRREMHYTNATIDEILRISSIVPTGVPHRCREDTELLGYAIAKDMVVITNLYSIHRDPSSWTKPYQFYPQHFLADDESYQPSENLMPFSLGRRACIGEGLAKMEIFLFFVSVFQNFSVKLADGQTDPEVIMAGVGGAQRRLLPHSVIFTAR